MNDLIKNLAEQASREVREERPDLTKGYSQLDFLLGRVPKCQTFTVNEYEVEKLVELAVKNPEIRKHFGVE